MYGFQNLLRSQEKLLCLELKGQSSKHNKNNGNMNSHIGKEICSYQTIQQIHTIHLKKIYF